MSTAAVAPPTPGSSQPGGSAGAGKNAARARNLANQKRYANPLPILFNTPSSAASSSKSKASSSSSSGLVLSSFFPSARIEVPQCVGSFDPITRSVWIEDERSKHILFTRGFFGKGSLSRSEPSWRERRVALLKGGATLAAEQMREQRRIARKQFKIDRAAAMLDAAKQAEAILTSSVRGSSASIPGSPSPLGQVSELNAEEEVEAEEENEDIDVNVERSGSPTPSSSTIVTDNTVIDPMNLTPQTFLVRPTRPEANRNRGRKAFKRRPPPAQTAQPATSGTGEASSAVIQPRQQTQTVEQKEEEEEEEEEEDLFDESLVEEMEHLQLSLEEALFLTLGLGVLRVFDPTSQTYIPNGPALLSLLLTPPSSLTAPLSIPTTMLPDDPLLVSYIAYHHYRSLGWVVKDGIKFCCDWLLYRRGPAFSHSAFACIVIPVYEDPSEKESSPYGNEDWYDQRLSWKWVNTIMRVNALVQKTVIAVYVTIPSLASFDQSHKLDNGYLDPGKIDFKSLLGKYTVREVSLTRFGPSRRRD
ncbi:tRNA-intron endonuclease [Kwoniella bestiolae CBS 10118]|uniref:tRNA-intron lyase n=1 Tax=Kwoniella bestiolae CBS 10118 TaxID=1296100 RepID=A0A1B9GEU1_9TREE|nr:tRNA-intron endonuclease [Kwoniella bestiolae CBS 10118]OCF29554.1 tRNA-intron endonuclease [Kwoniella bestiolae CBS 10118]